MAKQRFTRSQKVTVRQCERCDKSHEYPIEVVFDREVDAMGMMGVKSDTQDVVLTCPTTGQSIVVSVPIFLDSLETFVEIRRGRSQ